jgi:hypothetical protein
MFCRRKLKNCEVGKEEEAETLAQRINDDDKHVALFDGVATKSQSRSHNSVGPHHRC